MNIDDLKYGNPTKYQEDVIKQDIAGLLDKSIKLGIIEDMLKNHPFPKNSSDITKKELLYLKRITDSLDETEIKFLQMMEDDHYTFFEKVANKLGIDVNRDTILGWCKRIDPITFYLKDKYNRPRPFQLSDYLGIELRVPITTDAFSGAYPSGHTIDFLVIIHNLLKTNPYAKKALNELYNSIRSVREKSGVHYPSDTKVSEILVKKLIEKKVI